MEEMDQHDSLLSTITEDGPFDRNPVERITCPYAQVSRRFRLQEKKFKTQYAHVYYCRLTLMKEIVEKAAKRQWGEDISIRKLVDVKMGEDVCVIGTTFKEMCLKPSILKEISDDNNLLPFPPKKRKYISSADSLVLEDESQRVVLAGNIPTQELITGIVMAVKGRGGEDGRLHVEEYCFAGVPPLARPEVSVDFSQEEDKYIAIVSGLNIGSDHCSQLSVEVLVDYLAGHLGGPRDRDHLRRVVRVIIAGNSITDKPTKSAVKEEKKKKYLAKNYAAQSIEAMKELDGVLAQLASCVPVDIMPGSHDPVNYTLPQQPFHKCVFPRASKHNALRGVTNPFIDEISGRIVLGCSGQNVEDIYRFSKQTDRLSILEQTLEWGHIAPTAPDTLGCYPFNDDDPFVLKESAHIYFTANQPSFQHKKTDEGILLITVPNFDLTHSCVLVNLKTLDCSELKISAELPEEVDQGHVSEEEEEVNEPLEEKTFNIMDDASDDDDM